MADEEFSISLAVTGEDKAARAFENLKLRQMEATAEATKLAAELRKLQQSGTATAEQIETASRALIRAKAAASDYGAQATRVNRAMQAQGQSSQAAGSAAQALGQRIGQTAGAFGNLGSVVGSVSPQVGALGGVVGAVGTAATAATGAMGPLGLALAGVSAAVTVGVALANQHAEAMREQALAAQEARDALDRLAIAQGDTRRTEDLFAGLLSPEETERQLELFRDRFDAINVATETERRQLEQRRQELAELSRAAQAPTQATAADLRSARLGGMAANDAANADQSARIQELERSIAASTNRLRSLTNDAQATAAQVDAARAALTVSEARAEAERERQRREAGAGAAARAAERAAREAEAAELARIERIKNAENEAFLHQESLLEARLNAIAEAHDREVRMASEAQDAIFEQRLEMQRQLEEKEQEEAERRKQRMADEDAAMLARQRELGAITGGMWDSIGGTVKDAAGDMFKFLISGAEGGTDAFLALLDSFLEATSVEYTIKALGEVANAVAAAARQDYAAAAQHGVAAALAAGVAAATGLASAAISVPSTGAGAGAPAQVGAGAGAGGSVTQNVTVQLYAPQAVFTEAERGELMARGFREAERARPGSARI